MIANVHRLMMSWNPLCLSLISLVPWPPKLGLQISQVALWKEECCPMQCTAPMVSFMAVSYKWRIDYLINIYKPKQSDHFKIGDSGSVLVTIVY